jgi:acyl-CoA reductase-like NAD-dependent aldehyde dehydrogenase
MLYTTPQYTPIHPLTLSHTPSHSSTPFGLSSNIFSTDYTKAERVGTQVKAGMLTINDFAMVPMVGSLPFGGVGDR